MNKPLRVLQVEDSESDAALIERMLERAGHEVHSLRVETPEQMRAALEKEAWDIVISDYRLPQFNAPAALRVLQESGLDIPFLVVSATIGDDLAIGMMKSGAHDYLMKDKLARLAQAVEREIREADTRRARARAEEALQRSEAVLHSVVGSALDAVIAIDSEGRIVLWNSAAENMFGYSATEATGQLLHELVVSQRLQEAALKGIPGFGCSRQGALLGRTVEVIACRRDGTEFPVELSIAPVNAPGSVQAVGIVRDITDRKHAEAALRESEQRWQFALEGSGDGVWDWSADTNSTYFSRQWKAMLGYEEHEISDRREEFDDRVHPEDRQAVREALEKHLHGDAPFYACEYRLRCKDGSYKWILGHGKVICRNAAGDPLRVIGVHTDITPLKAAEAEREKLRAQFLQAQKMESIGRLAGGVAHDFNNLLTVINGYAHLMLGEISPSSSLHEPVEEIRRAGERATELVRQLLAFSRNQVLKEEVIDVNELIQNLHKMLCRLVGEDVEVVNRLDPSVPAIRADRHQMEQVIMNLAVNARDAMPRGGTLVIETGEGWEKGFCDQCHSEIVPGNYVRISVRDSGTGIDAEARQHLFEPFFTTKELGKGTGLGLATVQGIVLQSGGHISFETEIDKGTTFDVYLPAVATTAPPQPEAPFPVVNVAGSETILLVEDEADVRRFIVRVLEGCGYRVFQAANGNEALEFLQSAAADLLISDIVMPKMSGRELADRVRAIRPGIKVLFMSGYPGDLLGDFPAVANAASFIQKPFDPLVLVAKVRTLLGCRHTPDYILVVDDEPGIRRLFHSILEKAGYAVAEAADGNKALALIEELPVRLVITDLVMPDKEGIETIQVLHRDYPAIGIIAVSGAGGGRYLELAHCLGASASLSKPIDPEQLLAEVRRCLAAQRA